MTDDREEEDEYTEEELAELTTTSPLPKEIEQWLIRDMLPLRQARFIENKRNSERIFG